MDWHSCWILPSHKYLCLWFKKIVFGVTKPVHWLLFIDQSSSKNRRRQSVTHVQLVKYDTEQCTEHRALVFCVYHLDRENPGMASGIPFAWLCILIFFQWGLSLCLRPSICQLYFWLFLYVRELFRDSLHGIMFCLVIMSCMCPTSGAGRSIPLCRRPSACAVWPTLLEAMVFSFSHIRGIAVSVLAEIA